MPNPQPCLHLANPKAGEVADSCAVAEVVDLKAARSLIQDACCNSRTRNTTTMSMFLTPRMRGERRDPRLVATE